MPSAFRNQKNLAEWIDLDYFKESRGLKRWRWTLTWMLLLGSTAVVVLVYFLPGASRLVQAAPVSESHAMFNNDCAACHLQQFATARKLLPGNSKESAVPDHACLSCHDGPAHNNRVQEELHCAVCHKEHRGAIKLSRVLDAHCTSCHSDIHDSRIAGAPGKPAENVTGFSRDHPEFRILREQAADTASVKFNHHAHLGKPIFNGKRKENGERETVTLNCAKCHTPDDSGRYMQPINYEKHCMECHQLKVNLVGDFPGLDAKVKEFGDNALPHRSPEIVRGVLRERLVAFVQDNKLAAGKSDDERLIDPGVLGKRPSSRPVTEAEWKVVAALLGDREKVVFSNAQIKVNEDLQFSSLAGCRYCHVDDPKAKGNESGLPTFADTKIPPRWLKQAHFGHTAHRMLDCAECHNAAESKLTSDVLMPSVKSCQKCHDSGVGVRSDCSLCHKYHMGESKQTLPRFRTIEEALQKLR